MIPGYLELARGAVAAAGESVEAGAGPAAALTGPVARGDRGTVERQLAALRQAAPELVPLVVLLGREALARIAETAPLTPAQRELAEAFSDGSLC